MNILQKIMAVKEQEVKVLYEQGIPVFDANVKTRPSLFETLQKSRQIEVISEMKRASPSKGMIAEGADPVKQAQIYEQAGAAAISVLTDEQFFKGSAHDLAAVSKVVNTPILFKDFLMDTIQIDVAKAAGASIVLLIVAALEQEKLAELYTYATKQGLEILVEVHDEDELQRALAIGAKLIGVNNRDLRTFEVSLDRTREIAAVFPFSEERVLISESGIFVAEDAKAVAAVGASAVLVGEALMRSGDAASALRALQVEKPGVVK